MEFWNRSLPARTLNQRAESSFHHFVIKPNRHARTTVTSSICLFVFLHRCAVMFAFSIGNAFLVVIYNNLVLNKILFVHSFVVGGVGGVKRPAEDSKEEPSEKKNLPITAKTYIPKTHPVSSSVSPKVAQNRPPSHFIQNSSSNKHVSTAPTQ